ncbi:RsiV family protein [Paenibacillus massiliensis]|uniref:RsiV family protein n=1 Tax=Paenibacillus massiliensis TaxID=225917 RepID=UPI00046FC02F|nr:RsiV family protein [Paenibacillus massiliensis]
MNKLEQSKKIYDTIEPPSSYNHMIQLAVNQTDSVKNRRRHITWYKPVLVGVGSVFATCVILLNTSPAFAMATYEIPVVGDIARVFTFKEYQVSDTAYDIQVEMPSIRNTGNTELEKRVNGQIQNKIDYIVENAKLRGKQIIDDQLAAGSTKDNISPFHIIITYDIKSNNEDTLSFVVNHVDSAVTSYTYQTFFNIDLKTGKDITLSSMLGENYADIITDSIQKRMEQRVQAHPDWVYNVTGRELKENVDSMKFYINEAGNVVISFDKGEIAPPPLGIQDFEITK